MPETASRPTYIGARVPRIEDERLLTGRARYLADIRLPRTAEEEIGGCVRVGFTASRKVGIAVARNRARRRLRAVVAEIMPEHAAPGHDYVLVARAATLKRPYSALAEDLRTGLRRLGVFCETEAGPD